MFSNTFCAQSNICSLDPECVWKQWSIDPVLLWCAFFGCDRSLLCFFDVLFWLRSISPVLLRCAFVVAIDLSCASSMCFFRCDRSLLCFFDVRFGCDRFRLCFFDVLLWLWPISPVLLRCAFVVVADLSCASLMWLFWVVVDLSCASLMWCCWVVVDLSCASLSRFFGCFACCGRSLLSGEKTTNAPSRISSRILSQFCSALLWSLQKKQRQHKAWFLADLYNNSALRCSGLCRKSNEHTKQIF